MKEDLEKTRKEAVRFLTDTFGVPVFNPVTDKMERYSVDKKTGKKLYWTRQHEGSEWLELRQNSLADYAEEHAVAYAIYYDRVPEDLGGVLPAKGKTPVDMTIPWTPEKKREGWKVHPKGGLTKIVITWQDGTTSEGVANCSLKDTFSYFEGRRQAVHAAIRDQVRWKRSIQRAQERADKEARKANRTVLSDAQETTTTEHFASVPLAKE
jgi:hypothetical protein